jgi:hypothetical protein
MILRLISRLAWRPAYLLYSLHARRWTYEVQHQFASRAIPLEPEELISESELLARRVRIKLDAIELQATLTETPLRRWRERRLLRRHLRASRRAHKQATELIDRWYPRRGAVS